MVNVINESYKRDTSRSKLVKRNTDTGPNFRVDVDSSMSSNQVQFAMADGVQLLADGKYGFGSPLTVDGCLVAVTSGMKFVQL